MSQRRLLRALRRWTLVLSALGACYLVTRFEMIELPRDRCCPVTRFEPGDRVLVDRRPSAAAPGDAVLVRGPSGGLHLALVRAVREGDGALWCAGDREGCDAFDSARDGWVSVEAVSGRVLLEWIY